ncbi:MAG: hypothetical protein V4608_09065 [Bacteroidota bacterium]
MQKKLRVLGIVSVVIGGIAALLALYPSKGLLFALPLGFAGMICSSIYIFIDTKNEINSKAVTPGIVGLFLSSIPVLLILIFIIINYFSH